MRIRLNPFRGLSQKDFSFPPSVIVPRDYGGEGLLGATIKYDVYDVEDSVNLRVTDVFPDSPAQMAGLLAGEDFLLGSEGQMFRDLDDLVDLVTKYKGRCITM